MDHDDKICYCYGVSFGKLWHFARRQKPRHASQMSECLNAGTGCGWCVPFLERIWEAARATDRTDGLIPETTDEYVNKRQSYLKELKKDGSAHSD